MFSFRAAGLMNRQRMPLSSMSRLLTAEENTRSCGPEPFEHAARVVLYALSAVFLVEMNNGFGITASPSEG